MLRRRSVDRICEFSTRAGNYPVDGTGNELILPTITCRGAYMHLIPQSWSHLHILVSVLPSVGLVFVLGFYVTAFVTDNEAMKRSCLVLFGILGILAIPTYFSGDHSMAVLSQDSKISRDLMDSHFGWGVASLAVLMMTGAVALIALWRFRRVERLSDNALHLVLGLAIVTLGLMVVVGELGWEISHHELRLDPATQKTPQAWSHVHMILNHFPTVGFVFALGFYMTALVMNNVVMKRSSLVLFVICAVLVVPTYVTGNASMWAMTDPKMPGISKAVINAHRDMALLMLFGLAFTGVAAWIELWRFRHLGRFSNRSLYVVLAFAIVTLGVMAETGHLGGQINHPEIRLATDVLPTDPKAGWSAAIELLINQVVWFVPWQTLHFFGFSLVFGTALAVSLRVLGFWKSVPFSAVHRLLPLGVFGVVMNVFSGMLILQADSFRYLNEITFVPKIIFFTIGAIAVLYFSVSEGVWNVKAGEDAPMSAKWVAALVLLSWAGVIMGGRLLPYVEYGGIAYGLRKHRRRLRGHCRRGMCPGSCVRRNVLPEQSSGPERPLARVRITIKESERARMAGAYAVRGMGQCIVGLGARADNPRVRDGDSHRSHVHHWPASARVIPDDSVHLIE